MKYVLLILLVQPAFAESFKIAGNLISFKESNGLMLKGCDSKCDALKAIKKHPSISLSEARKGMKFSNSVGSDVCARVYKAESLIGIAENGDQRAFCFFKDKSMVEMNSLSRYLIDKKIVRE